MKIRRDFFLSCWSYYVLMLALFGGIVLALFFTIRNFSAFVYYDTFQENKTEQTEHAENALQVERLRKAIRNDRNHAEYRFALGHTLLQKTIEEEKDQPASAISAEIGQLLREAVWLDPSNPKYYYELGRLSSYRENCPGIDNADKEGERCATARYFRTALCNAPKDLFLRQAIGEWFAVYDREAALRLIRRLLEDDRESLKLVSPNQFRSFLYEHQMDYESDLILEGYPHLTQACHDDPLQRNGNGDDRTYEIRHDDGTGEWSTLLVSDHDRIKKTFCLPADMERYESAVLRLFMHRAADSKFSLILGVNEHTITLKSELISEQPKWHTIPFDPGSLRGKSRVHVYIRVKVTSLRSPPALYIWGDRNAQNRYSTFLLKTLNDLSPEEGTQNGEYMIRLILSTLV